MPTQTKSLVEAHGGSRDTLCRNYSAGIGVLRKQHI